MTETTPLEIQKAFRASGTELRIVLGRNTQVQQLSSAIYNYGFFESSTDDSRNPVAKSKFSSLVLGEVADEVEGVAFVEWESAETYEFLAALGEALSPSVVHLNLEDLGCGEDPVAVPVGLITFFLEFFADNLQSLTFDGVTLTGINKSECETFSELIGRMKGLRSFQLGNNFDFVVDEEPYKLNDLLMNLAQLPLLQKVEISTYCWYDEGYPRQLTGVEPIQRLIANTNIQELILGNFHFENHGFRDVAQALAQQSHVRKLELHFSPSSEDAKLDNLMILADMLLENTTLESIKLEVEGPSPKLDPFCLRVAQHIQNNPDSALLKFKVMSPCLYDAKVEEAFLTTLQTTNYTLERLALVRWVSAADVGHPNQGGDDDEENEDACYDLEGTHRSEINLLLRLNSRGKRKYLMTHLDTITRDTWINTFASLTHDLEGLFHYLRINPWLCHDHYQTNAELKRERAQQAASQTAGSNENGTSNNEAGMAILEENSTRSQVNEYQQVMERLQQQFTNCMVETSEEIQKLNQKHDRDKNRLEEELLRLREENASLRAELRR